MGIKNFHRFLRKHAPELYNEKSLSEYSGKRFAVDISIYLYKYKSVYKDKWISMFFGMLVLLKKYNIQLVFVYDTKSPAEKNDKKEERKQKRKSAERRIQEIYEDMNVYQTDGEISPLLRSISESRGRLKVFNKIHSDILDQEAIQYELEVLSKQMININIHDIRLSKRILDIMGIPYLASDSEAEALCSYLCCHGKVDAVLSDDTDVTVYGVPVFLTKLNVKNETVIEFNIQSILEKLNLTLNQFIDFCILCGTDYNSNIPNIGNEKAYQLITKHTSIEEIEKSVPNIDVGILNYKRVREIFSIPSHLDDVDIVNKQPDIKQLAEFVFVNKLYINSLYIEILQNNN